MIFNRDTILYHPVEGAKLFPQGEQHPGLAWFDNPECSRTSESATADLQRDLAVAQNAVQRLQGELDAANSQIAGQARAHEVEIEALRAEAVTVAEAHAAAVVLMQADIDTLIGQRDAAAKGAPAPVLTNPPDLDGDGKPGGSEPDDAAEKAEKASIRAEIKALGFGEIPGPRASIQAFRDALVAARAAAKAAE